MDTVDNTYNQDNCNWLTSGEWIHMQERQLCQKSFWLPCQEGSIIKAKNSLLRSNFAAFKVNYISKEAWHKLKKKKKSWWNLSTIVNAEYLLSVYIPLIWLYLNVKYASKFWLLFGSLCWLLNHVLQHWSCSTNHLTYL